MSFAPLTGRTAIVTGVTRRIGIGAAIARRLAEQGADLLLQGWEAHDAEKPWGVDADGASAIAAELRAGGHRVEYVSADFSDPEAPAAVLQAGIDAFGHVDVLVANHARSTPWAPLAELTAAEIDASFAINTRATLLLVKEFAGHFSTAADVDGGDGRIVLFTSGQHNGPMPAEIPYATSKAALAGITASLAAAVARQRITVNCVNPGPTDTGWATPEITEAALRSMPFGRWGRPEDAAALVAFLVGPDGGWVTGQVISSEGGFGRG
ncbi:SDR family oxidoreductase [Pseudonocardia sp. GCM10023141]|uniref:SDR family oxidoreductase n=1 Tax=Pseudonocardia sp. GCM10023141 TaxID=3252653 RepID=UPI00361C34A0